MVAALGKAPGRQLGQGVAGAEGDLLATAVGRADQDGGPVAGGLGPVVIRPQADAVGHGYGHVALHGDAVARRRKLEEASQQGRSD